MGRDVTLSRLVARVFFPCIKGEVAGYIEACRTCQTKHGKGSDQRHTLRSMPAGYPFQRIHIDLVGPLNKGARTGASNILTVRDAFTKWVEAIPLTATTTLEVARALDLLPLRIPRDNPLRSRPPVHQPVLPGLGKDTWYPDHRHHRVQLQGKRAGGEDAPRSGSYHEGGPPRRSQGVMGRRAAATAVRTEDGGL